MSDLVQANDGTAVQFVAKLLTPLVHIAKFSPQVLVDLVDARVITINEAREALGLSPIKELLADSIRRGERFKDAA
jgi:hypothetical protein